MSLNLSLKDFLKYLSRFKWMLILIPLLCVIVTYFFVKELPKNYKSEALISTGLTSRFEQTALAGGQNMDYFKLSQQFGNLLEMIKSKRNINLLSYKLILHDLKDPDNAFQPYSKEIKKLSEQEKQVVIAEFEKKYSTSSLLSLADNKNLKLFDIMKSTGYGEKNLLSNLDIMRHGESDLIKVVYTSQNPDLSAYVVNNLSNDFINYYTELSLTGQRKSLAILDTVLREKQMDMENKNAVLSGTSASSAANASSAASANMKANAINQQIAEAEAQKLTLLRNISSINGAIDEINNKLSGSGGYINQDAIQENSEIINIDNLLEMASRRYVNNNFRPQDKATMDSLQRIKSRLITSSASKQTGYSAARRHNLIAEKIKLENDLASVKSALSTVENQLAAMGPRREIQAGEAGIGNVGTQNALARDADVASKEYTDAQTKYDQMTLATKTGAKLSIAEPGLPGPAEPSKNTLFLGLSGASSFMICVLTLFVAFMLNTTINTQQQLEAATGHKVIGSINYLNTPDKDLRSIWDDNDSVPAYTLYKDLLRSLRFELNELLTGDDKVLGITSLLDGEGKSFISGSLSYAFAMTGKNVLLICDKNATLMDLVSNKADDNENPSTQVFESFLVKKQIKVEDRITILNRNQNNSSSLLELKDSNSLVAGFKVLKDTFDVIIIDIDSSQEIHKVKEWLMFCDKSIAVFEAGSKITDGDRSFVKYLGKDKGFSGWVLNKVKVAKS